MSSSRVTTGSSAEFSRLWCCLWESVEVSGSQRCRRGLAVCDVPLCALSSASCLPHASVSLLTPCSVIQCSGGKKEQNLKGKMMQSGSIFWKSGRCMDNKGLGSLPRRCFRCSYEAPWVPEAFHAHQKSHSRQQAGSTQQPAGSDSLCLQ